MQFAILERLILLGLLPTEGNLVKLRQRKALMEKVSFTDKEIAEWKIVSKPSPNGTYNYEWNPPEGVIAEAEIELTATEEALFRDALVRLNEQGRLKPDQMSLCEKLGVE